MRTLVPISAVALLAVWAAPSPAADPATGSVSNADPKVTWSGATSAGFATTFSEIFVNLAGLQQPCQAPSCDEFALDVKDGGDLTVSVTAAGSSITYLQIVKPDGSAVYADGGDEEGKEDNTTVIKLRKAAPGAYKIQAAQNALANDTYTGSAQLGTIAAPAAPKTSPEPGTSPQPGASPPRPSATLTVKAGKLSAKKLNRARKLAVGLSASSPVTDVKVSLAAGKKVVATGALAKLTRSGNVKLKLKRKLKPGKYTILVTAKDGASNVGATAKLKVNK